MSEPQRIKEAVKEAYASLATERNAATDSGSCQPPAPLMDKLLRYGYSPEELAMANDTQMPYLYITIKGASGSYSYSVPDAFSSFMIDQSLLPSLPFPAVHGYYLDQQIQLTALLLNYGFTSPRPLRRLGLRERRGTGLRLSHNLRTGKPQQNLRVPPRREQHDLCESRRRRREPGRHPGQPVHLPHHGHGRTTERRGRLPLG